MFNDHGSAARTAAGLLLAGLLCAGCSVRRYAASALADALATSGDTFATDDDPDLIRDASPFALKLHETLLADNPDHRGLLLATSRSFTQYAVAFVQEDADELEPRDLAAATALRRRAANLHLRARDYALRAWDLTHQGFADRLRRDPRAAVAQATRDDVPLLYWTAAAWGSAIALSKDRPDLIADQPVVEALIDRALTLDESFDHGALHTFLIGYEPARRGQQSDPADRARRHLRRAVELSGGQSAAPLVAFAESVCVPRQDRAEFVRLLDQALAIDVNARPQRRLANLIMQRRARRLLSRADELFVE